MKKEVGSERFQVKRKHLGFISRVEMVKEVEQGLVGGEGRLEFVVVGVIKGQEVWFNWGVQGLPRGEDHQFVEKVETLDVETGLEFEGYEI